MLSHIRMPNPASSTTPLNHAPFSASFARLSKRHPHPWRMAFLALSSLPLSTTAWGQLAAQQPIDETPPLRVSSASAELPSVSVTGQKPADDYRVDTATVGGKQATAVHDLPQAITIVDDALLKDQAITSLAEALRNVPGITLSAGEGGQIGNNINLRGFSARTDIYMDGFRDRGQYQRDTFSLDAVEVLEGPSSLLFGRGSTGGVINQVSKQAQRRTAGDVSFTGTVDPNDSQASYRATAGYTHALGSSGALRLDAMGQKLSPTRDVVTNQDYGLAPSLRLGIGGDTEVRMSLLSQHNDDIPDYGIPLLQFSGQSYATPIDAPHRRYYGYRNDQYTQDVNLFGLGLTHHLDSRTQLRNQVQYSHYRTQAAATPLGSLMSYNTSSQTYSSLASTTLSPSTPLDALQISVQQRDRIIRDDSLYNQLDLLIERDTGPVRHHFVAGAEVGRDTYTLNYFSWYNFNYNNGAGLGANLVDVFSLGARDYTDKPSGANVFRVPWYTTDTQAEALAGYFNDQMDFGAHWKAVAGLRWDRYAARQSYTADCYAASSTCPTVTAGSLTDANSGLITSNNDPSQTAAVQAHNAAVLTRTPVVTHYDSARTDYHLSTRGGVIYQPTSAQSYYAAYGTSFNPLAEAVAGLPTSANAQNQYDANGGAAPETSHSYEIGSRWELLQQRLSVSTALFQITKDNARNLDPTTQTYTLDGEIRVNGAELRVSGALLPMWQVYGGYTWLDGKIISSPVVGNTGSVPQNTPRNAATLWNAITLDPHWQLGGGVSYATRTWTNNTDTAQVPGYTRYDAMLSYQWARWNAQLNLQNLSDARYFSSASGGRATPVDARRALLTLSYHFAPSADH